MDVSTLTEADRTALTEQGYSDADLGMLADTEIKALLRPESDDDSESDADPHGAAAAEQDEAVAAAAVEPGKVAAEEEEAEPPAADAQEPPTPLYKVEVPPDAKEKIAALRAEDAKEFKRLMDGEIDAEEYQKTKNRVEGEVDDLKSQVMQAKFFERANTQAADAAARIEWQRSERAAFDAFKADGLDYKAKPALLAAYNTNLKAIGADPKNDRRDASWFLTEAHRLTMADLGIAAPAAKKTPTPIRRGVDTTELPPTLRGIPAAGNGAVNADEFAHVRNLNGLALEKAVAGMTEAQRDRWMSE